jgi:ribosomal-protein-alanine N-acetyltransferase
MADDRVPVLETPRMILTLPAEQDADEIVAYLERNGEHLRPWSPPQAPGARTREGALRRVAVTLAEFRAGSSFRFWFRRREAPRGAFIGAASLSNIVLGAFRACYLGYHLDVAHSGQGLMHEALSEIIRYAFRERQLHRIMANYLPSNERSARVLSRLGFVVEGYAAEYLFIDGAFRDHVLTALTNRELEGAERLCTPNV